MMQFPLGYTKSSTQPETASPGFVITCYDLYSYNTKHNEKNGWNNTDGDNNGNSWNRLNEYREIHDFFRYMIAFRKKYTILRKPMKPASCGLPEISIHNGYPWNSGTDGELLDMQLPKLPENMRWKICVNTSEKYEDGKEMELLQSFIMTVS